MPATIISSWGGPGSNCYCEVTSASAYFETKVGDLSMWTDASTAQQIASLIQATRLIDANPWRGTKYYWDQRLEFPRTLFDEGDNRFTTSLGTPYALEYAQMQEDVIAACAEQAFWLIKNSGVDELRELQDRGVKSYSESIGKISESYTFNTAGARLMADSSLLLRKYRSSPRVVRG